MQQRLVYAGLAASVASSVSGDVIPREYAEALKATHPGRCYVGRPDYKCQYCGAVFWYHERVKSESAFSRRRIIYNMCCKAGKVYGTLDVQRVACSFYILVHGLNFFVAEKFIEGSSHVNVSHVIHDLSFSSKYPGIHNPLDETTRILHDTSGTFKYYIKGPKRVFQRAYLNLVKLILSSKPEHMQSECLLGTCLRPTQQL